MNIGSAVIIPRTGGGESPGEVLEIYTDRARVKFQIGETYRGRVAPEEIRDLWGYKTVLIKDLRVREGEG